MSQTSDLVFSFVHLAVLLAALGYAVYSLCAGNVARFAVIVVLLAIYFWAVLLPPIRKEIARRRSLKNK